MVQAWELEAGKQFRWQDDIFRVESDNFQEGNNKSGYVVVTRIASLWPKESNRWLKEDTWFPSTSYRFENFNPYADVIPVRCRIICEVEEIKKPSIIPAVDAASNPTGK